LVKMTPAALYSKHDARQRRPRREPMMLETSRYGVFAAGDVGSGSVKRVASAVGEGSMAIRQTSITSGTDRLRHDAVVVLDLGYRA
jgi:thioredoxin reductase (NADPH)